MNVTPDQSSTRPGWYLRPVVLLSWLALALTVGLLLTFLVQAGMFDTLARQDPVEQPEDLTQEKVVVKSSSLKGFDSEKQPYTIDSITATQDPDKPNLVSLNTVTGKLRKASGQIVTIAADNGVYNSRTKTLNLAGNVRIVSPDRFTATMPTARITLENKQLFTKDHVVVTLKSGDITSDGLKIVDEGKNITFLSRVKAKLRSSADKGNKQQ